MRIWLDTEFNGWGGPLISMALVAEDGREWYRALACEQPTPWVVAHVLPVLQVRPSSREQFRASLWRWLRGFDRMHVVADWPEDFEHFCAALITRSGYRLRCAPLTMEMVDGLQVQSAVPHNALEDARGLRAAHLQKQGDHAADAGALGVPEQFQRLLARVDQMLRESGDPTGFNASAWLSAWLQTGVPALGGARPVDILELPGGFEKVLSLLLRMRSGAYS
jgi:uncharacterized protein (DUF2384 family)